MPTVQLLPAPKIPIANQFKLVALRIKSIGLAQAGSGRGASDVQV
jgi:hypothetical protein